MPPRRRKKDAPPPRELIPRESKSRHYARGAGKPRGTSTSPSRLVSTKPVSVAVNPFKIDDFNKSTVEVVAGLSQNLDVLGVSNDDAELRNGEPPRKIDSPPPCELITCESKSPHAINPFKIDDFNKSTVKVVAGLSQNLDAVGVSTDDGKLDSDYRKLNNDHVSQSNAGQSAEPAMILKGKSLSDTDISQKFRLRACSEMGDSETRVRANKDEPEPRQGQGQGQGAPRQGQGMQRKEQGGVLLVAGNADNLVRELHHGGNSVNDGYLGDTPVCDDVAVTQPQELRVPEGGVLAQVDSNDEGFAMVEHGYRLEVDDNYSVLTVHSTSSSSADDACSYDSRFEMLDTVAVPLRRLPNTYIMDLVIAVELEYFGTRHDVRGDGQCGYYSIMHSLILHFRRVSPNHPSLNDEFSEVSFRKATWFRYMLYEYINQHYDELVAEKSPIIVDQDGLQVTDFNLNGTRGRVGKGITSSSMFSHDGRPLREFDWKVDKIYNIKYFGGLKQNKVSLYFYMDSTFLLPIIARKYCVSIFCYNPNGSYSCLNSEGEPVYDTGKSTSVYYYRPDGKVQCHKFQGYRKPFPDAIAIYYDGANHFNYVTMRSDITDWSDPPTVDESFHTHANESDPPNCETHANESDHCTLNEASLLHAKESSRRTSNDHSQEHTNEHCANESHAKSHTAPANCTNNGSPVTASKIMNATSFISPMLTNRTKNVDSTQNKSSMNNKSPLKLHKNPFPSPMKENITQMVHNFGNPYIIGEIESADGKVVHLKSEGSYKTSISRNEFESLLQVTQVPINGSEPSVMLQMKWKKGNERNFVANLVTSILLRHNMFKDHYTPLFPNGAEVVSAHKVGNEGKAMKKSRAKHDLVAYLNGSCSHHVNARRKDADISGKCTSTLKAGFKLCDVKTLLDDDYLESISIHMLVSNDCHHRKHHNPNQVRGKLRSDFIAEQAFDHDGNYMDPSPKLMYQKHNSNISETPNTDGTNCITVKNRSVANNLKRDMSNCKMRSHGLTPGKSHYNFWKAVNGTVEIDINRRKQYELQRNPENPRPINESYAGVLQTYEYIPSKATRGSSPLMVNLFSANDVKLYNCLASTNRLVLHIDGSSDDMPLEIHLKDHDVLQKWPLVISPSFMFQKRSPAARRKISPTTIMELHSVCTSSVDMAPQFKKFFDAQHELCGSYFRPLLVESDCAKGIPTTFLIALSFEVHDPVSRIQYNNLILMFLVQYEVDNWNTDVTSTYFKLMRQLVPCFFGTCRPHVCRATGRWIKSDQRDNSIKTQRRAFKRITTRLFTCGTGILSVSETIVNFGLVAYIVSKPNIKAKRHDLLSKSSSANKVSLSDVGSKCMKFVNKMIEKVKKLLSTNFQIIVNAQSISEVESKKWMAVDLALMVKLDAQLENLDTTVSFCSDHQQGTQEITSSFCFGLLPDDPGKDVYPTWEHYTSDRTMRFVSNIVHNVATLDILNQDEDDDYVSIANPLFSKSYENYIINEWMSSVASWNCSIQHVCQVEVKAPVDNSNGISEVNFKWKKRDKQMKLCSSDAGLYLFDFQSRSYMGARQFIHDVEQLYSFAEEASNRKKRNTLKSCSMVEQTVAKEDATDNIWRRDKVHSRKMDKLKGDLHCLLGFEDTRISNAERFAKVNEYMQKVGVHEDTGGNGIVQCRPFINWVSGLTNKPKFLCNKEATDALITYAEILRVQQTGNIESTQTAMNTVSVLDCDGGYREVVAFARGLRKEWSLLENPEELKMPHRVSLEISSFINSIAENKKRWREFATASHTSMGEFELTEDELDGEAISDGDGTKVVQDRLLIGMNLDVSGNEHLFFCSRFSLSVMATPSEVKKLVRDTIPQEILSQPGDTKELLAQRFANSTWLDAIHIHSKSSTYANGDVNYKCPMRRTLSLSTVLPHVIEDKGAIDHGRSVTTMFSYTIPEMPVKRWMSRPMSLLDLALIMECWKDTWPFLSKLSRTRPPNWMQVCVYNALMGSKMGMHRDNYDKGGLSKMRLGKSPVTNKTYHGVPNSQVHGTNVIVFTVGNYPMKMVFAYPNPHYDIEQDVSKYLMLESFSIKCGEGHITILDPLDDVLMQHGVMFEDLSLVQVIDTEGRNGNEGETDLRHRIAFVMRWLGNEEEYYMDTSTIRLNEKMKEAMKKSTANNEFDDKGRSAYD